jgi:hypothetical protein
MLLKKSLIIFSLFTMLFTIVSCEDDVTSDNPLSGYVGVEEAKNIGLVLNETKIIESHIYASDAVGADRVFSLSVNTTSTHNASYYSVPATVTIPAGSKIGTFNVSLTGSGIASAGNTLIIDLGYLSGVDQSTTYTGSFVNDNLVVSQKQIVYNISEVCQTGTTKVTLSIKFDNYPEETAWELYNSNFSLIASGGFNAAGTAITGYAALGFADRSTFVSNFCLAPGDYTFVIYDDYGDGMYTSATVSGNYSLKLADGTTLASGGGNFGTNEVSTFTIN